jgi:ligand-binding sensor domain-containing protein
VQAATPTLGLTATPSPAQAAIATPTQAPPAQSPEPAEAEWAGQRIDLTSDAVQYWSNPNSIHDLLFDGTSLWAATYGGLVQWHGEGDYRIYTVRDGLASQAVAALALDAEGRLWLGYEDVDGWTVRQGEEWQHWSTRRQAVEANYATLLGAQRTHPRLWATRPESAWVWLPRGDGSIQAYDGGRWRVYGADNGVTAQSHWVGVSPEGQVWAVGQGVSTAQEGELWWDDHTFFSEVTGADDVHDVVVDAEGTVWIGFANHAGGGLIRYNLAVQRWEGHLAEINPAIPPQVYALELDRDGTLWVGGAGRLSYRAPLRQFRTYDLGAVSVLSFAREGQTRIWLGTDQGLYWLDAETQELHGPWVIPSPLPDNQITGLAIDAEGVVYVGTPRGISWIDDQGQTDLLTDQGVQWLGADAQGRLWAATSQGVGRQVAGGAFEFVYDQGPVLAVTLGPEQTVYLCTPEGLLLRVGDQGVETVADIYAWTGALPRGLVVDGQGVIWVATAEGLARVEPDGTQTLFTDGDEGPLSRDIRAVALDVDDTLWLATARGLARRRADGRWTRFTTESTGGGLRSMDMRDVAVGPLGDLWMATQAGISRREPAEADWSYLDVPGAQRVLYDGRGAIWVATRAGLYRIAAEALAALE